MVSAVADRRLSLVSGDEVSDSLALPPSPNAGLCDAVVVLYAIVSAEAVQSSARPTHAPKGSLIVVGETATAGEPLVTWPGAGYLSV